MRQGAAVSVDLTRDVPAVCGHCGRDDVGTPAVARGAIHGVPVCIPRLPGRPHCWTLVLRFQHPLDCRCEERYPIAGDRDRTVWA